MATHAAFLRGINVGKRTVKGPQLIDLMEEAGFSGVATFRASGNAVFDAKGRADAIGRKVEGALESALGFEVTCFIRTGAQLRKIAAEKPFTPSELRAAGNGKLQVVLLAGKPAKKSRDAIAELEGRGDLLKLKGAELYWLPAGGLMKSPIGMHGIAKAAGPNTIRTMGTVEQMAEKFFPD